MKQDVASRQLFGSVGVVIICVKNLCLVKKVNNMWPFHKHDFEKTAETYSPPFCYSIGEQYVTEETWNRMMADKRRDAKGYTTIVWKCKTCQKFHKEILAGKSK